LNEENTTYQYNSYRGISEETFRKYQALTKCSSDGKPISIGFKYGSATKVRTLDSKSFYWIGQHKPGLFGYDRFEAGAHRYVCITEGELDALSVWQATGVPSLSVQSAASAVSDCTAMRSYLNSYERIYLFFDSDAPGRECTNRVAKLFDYSKVFHVRLSHHKDANELLQAEGEFALKQIFYAAKKYLPETIVSSFEDFEKILSATQTAAVSYPFPAITEYTGGIRLSESVLVTAQEGVGKTELMHVLEHHLLKETNSNVGAIFLEEPKRRHLQALAGLELKDRIHLPERARSLDEEVSALTRAIGRDDRLHVYSHFGSDDPEVLLDTIRFMVAARQCNYILLDHVSMVVSGLAGEDERRALDYIATRLEMMVKELNFSLIMVSHVNDFGQTRGSRYLSKIADIRLDLSRDLLSTDPLIRNTTDIVISKNRFSGRTGYACSLVFNPNTGEYNESNNHKQNQYSVEQTVK
jgi:twinkle protein